MSYGLEVYDAALRAFTSTRSGIPAVSPGVYTFPAGNSSMTLTFSGYAGKTGFCNPSGAMNRDGVSTSWSYPNGTPTLTLSRPSPSSSDTDTTVFVILR